MRRMSVRGGTGLQPVLPAILTSPLRLDGTTFRYLLEQLGPSLALWRAAEVAALREQTYEPPVVDLGCGDGLITSLVLDRVEIALDPDEEALNKAAGRGIYECFVAANAEEARLPRAIAGTVVSNSVLEHIPCLQAMLGRVAHMLRPGGRFIFTTPTEAFSHWLAVPSAAYAGWRNRKLQHLNLWPLNRWVDELDSAGFQVELVRPYLRRALVAAWDAGDLIESIWLAGRRLAGVVWRRLPPSQLARLARRGAQIDLSSPAPGGGRLILARKR